MWALAGMAAMLGYGRHVGLWPPCGLQRAPVVFCLIFATMVYKVIGLMSGSSLDGLDIAYVHLQDRAGKWEYEFVYTETVPYSPFWRERLVAARGLSALDYQLLHVDYGHWMGEQVLAFISARGLAYQVQLIASHGHTVFHLPARRMTAQLGDGAALAASTGINAVSDLRSMDLALGGQGAPIVPGGERLLFPEFGQFLNLGGIANISSRAGAGAGRRNPLSAMLHGSFAAWDICPANRVLDLLAARDGRPYDDGGAMAATGRVDEGLLARLNALPYYGEGYPKSLANDFGTDIVYPMMVEAGITTADALCTYVEHIAVQVRLAAAELSRGDSGSVTGAEGVPVDVAGAEATNAGAGNRILVTGGGAHNHFLVGRLREALQPLSVEIVLPEKELIDHKEALVMALLGVLRWREENNVLASATGARRDSIGGAVWIGQEV
jgi:anhydro-N-acetylmuramic acid kinase